MKTLMAFLKICNRHVENDCEGCPFAYKLTGEDCHKWILHNPEAAADKLKAYIAAVKNPTGYIGDNKYRERCADCGHTTIITKGQIIYDAYLDDYVYRCPYCHTLQTAET